MRSRYDLAQDSTVKSEKGTYYKDIFTIPIQKFNYNNSSTEVTLSKSMIKRPDYLASNIYKSEAELDDLLLWLNNIGLIHYSSSGDLIDAPSMSDLENFYYKYRV